MGERLLTGCSPRLGTQNTLHISTDWKLSIPGDSGLNHFQAAGPVASEFSLQFGLQLNSTPLRDSYSDREGPGESGQFWDFLKVCCVVYLSVEGASLKEGMLCSQRRLLLNTQACSVPRDQKRAPGPRN